MAKEKEKVELRPVDEEAESRLRYVRIDKDAVEELEELPPVRVGPQPFEARLVAATREELKARSTDPDVGALIETDIPQLEEEWQTPKPVGTFPWGWVALVACVFALAILWSLYKVNRAEERGEELERQALAVIEREKREDLGATVLVSSLEKAARGFLDARSVEEMAEHVRHPERVRPLMETYYSEKAPQPVRVISMLSLDPLTIDNNASFWMVTCELEGRRQTQMLIEVLTQSEVKVDWESFVCYQPMAWDEFAGSRPENFTGDFRVYAQPDLFHSHEFSDRETFDCYRLTALNAEMSLYGYVKKGSPTAVRMSELFRDKPDSPSPMILRLHVPEGVQSPRGVLVKELVCPRWVFVDDPGKSEP